MQIEIAIKNKQKLEMTSSFQTMYFYQKTYYKQCSLINL